jgi:hypothetical protein
MTVKEEVHQVLKHRPENVSWGQLMYELYVRQKISAGLQAAEEGRVVSHEDVKKRFLAS